MSRPSIVTASAATASAVLVVLVLVSGCGTGDDAAAPVAAPTRAPNVVQGAAPGEQGRVVGPDESIAVDAPGHTAADIAFVQGMVHHHAQAMIMIDMLEGRSDHADLALFAERMDLSQTAEVELMEGWLSRRGEEVPPWERVRLEVGLRLADGGHGGDHGGHGHENLAAMPGMLTGEELDALAAARGTEFDRLWLEGMTRHHEGAMTMVRTLYADGGGGEPEVFRLASEIEGDQAVEIGRMAEMLAGL